MAAGDEDTSTAFIARFLQRVLTAIAVESRRGSRAASPSLPIALPGTIQFDNLLNELDTVAPAQVSILRRVTGCRVLISIRTISCGSLPCQSTAVTTLTISIGELARRLFRLNPGLRFFSLCLSTCGTVYEASRRDMHRCITLSFEKRLETTARMIHVSNGRVRDPTVDSSAYKNSCKTVINSSRFTHLSNLKLAASSSSSSNVMSFIGWTNSSHKLSEIHV